MPLLGHFLCRLRSTATPYAARMCSSSLNYSLIEPISSSPLQTKNGYSPGQHLVLTPDNVNLLAQTGAGMLRSGGVIAIPTDTLYGLAADVQNDDAISLLYDIKGRSFKKPVAICVAEIGELHTWAHVTVPRQLLEDFLPGPVTLVFERQASLNHTLNPGTNLIGIRIPKYNFTRELARQIGGPFALTSANPSSTPSTISPEEFKSLWPRLDGIFDGGRLGSAESHSPSEEMLERSGSTVIDLSRKGCFQIIRPGIAYDKSINILKLKYDLKEIV